MPTTNLEDLIKEVNSLKPDPMAKLFHKTNDNIMQVSLEIANALRPLLENKDPFLSIHGLALFLGINLGDLVRHGLVNEDLAALSVNIVINQGLNAGKGAEQ